MRPSATTPDEHLAALPDEVREDMSALDAALARIFAGDQRLLWEGVMWGGTEQRIIGYGRFRQVNRSGAEVDWFVVGLAVQKRHLSLYVSAVEDGQYLVKRHADRLGKVKVGNANVTFKHLADLDLPVVLEMAERARDLMVEA
jgi:hypothetical protein